MRTILVHLIETTEEQVVAYISLLYSGQETWVIAKDGDPCLYVDIYRDVNSEFEVEDWLALTECLGGEPSVGIAANISGRHPGDVEVQSFVCNLLRKFRGVAQDEYTAHCWTCEEILSGYEVQGHPFFDWQGWYEAQAGSA